MQQPRQNPDGRAAVQPAGLVTRQLFSEVCRLQRNRRTSTKDVGQKIEIMRRVTGKEKKNERRKLERKRKGNKGEKGKTVTKRKTKPSQRGAGKQKRVPYEWRPAAHLLETTEIV